MVGSKVNVNLFLIMAIYKSINPYNQELIGEFPEDSSAELEAKIATAQGLSPLEDRYSFPIRRKAVQKLASLLRERKTELADHICDEMGKVLKEAEAEVEKCAWLCDYYYEKSPEFLADQNLDLGDAQAIRRYEALGVILGIMPWNFPLWQVFRFAVPAILAGNRVLLKHAPNCNLSADDLQNLFDDAGLPAAAYSAVRLSNETVAELLKDARIKGVSLTGSEKAGRTVAEIAGRELKPQVLELGGSNAFILHSSAKVQAAAELASSARLLNAGQSCIAAKRFLVHESLYAGFIQALKAVFSTYSIGDPKASSTSIGPLARPDLKANALRQIEESLAQGAKLELGGKGEGNLLEPTILSGVNREMTVFKEEVFAPIASILSYSDFEEAIAISNGSRYGLGLSLIGEDRDFLLSQASRFEEGAVFINDLVKSDPRLPFGGVKNSGYGRELGPEGIHSFCNLKTIYLKGD